MAANASATTSQVERLADRLLFGSSVRGRFGRAWIDIDLKQLPLPALCIRSAPLPTIPGERCPALSGRFPALRSTTAEGRQTRSAEEQKSGRVAGRIDDVPGNEIAERSAEAPTRRGRTLREVVSARPLGEIGDDDEEKCSEDSCANAVEDLDRNKRVGILGHCVENAADRQYGEADEKDRFAPPSIGFETDQHGHRHHDDLGGDDARRHKQGLAAPVADCELLAEEGQHRCIGEMKERDCRSENQQRLAF
jgi:hypothetical protein